MKKRVTFSEAVLSRIKERRRRRVSNTVWVIFVIGLWTGLSILNYQMWKYRKQQTAPSWANFTENLPNSTKPQILERAMATSDDGVPVTLYINGELWDVVKVDAFDDAREHPAGKMFNGTQAETNCEHHLITYIQTDNPITLRTNLMHEVYHAGACIHDGAKWWNSENPTRDVHEGIKHLGEFNADFIRQNPVFIKWMMENE